MPRPRKRGNNKTRRIPWKIIRKHNRRRPPSSLEKKVYAWLDADKITYTREKSIGKYLHVDIFLAPKTCVELNGCHWHGCRICNKKLSDDQEETQIKDAKRYFNIRRMGFDLVVFWECEVNNYPDRVRAQLKTLAEIKK